MGYNFHFESVEVNNGWRIMLARNSAKTEIAGTYGEDEFGPQGWEIFIDQHFGQHWDAELQGYVPNSEDSRFC